MPDFPRPAAVAPVDLSRVAASVGAARLDGPDSIAVTGVSLDSRSVHPGDLYAALPGANVHGARFADGAQARGAAAVLTDEAGLAILRDAGVGLPVVVVEDPRAVLGTAAGTVYADPAGRRDLVLMGITGTNGKTTTAFVVDAALRALGRTTGLIGTVETRVAGERIRSERTTPEASDLHGLLATMAQRGVQVCTMEVSSHAMTLHRVGGVVLDVVAFTNLSQDHLDFHPSMEDYYAAKASLFTPGHARRGVVVVDDAWGERLAREATIPVVTVSGRPGSEADWVVEPAEGTCFVLRHGEESVTVRAPLPGGFNQMNTAVAVAMLVELAVPLRDAARAVESDPGVPGRMERVVVDADGPLAVVDFAHTPDAIASALAALRPQVAGRLVAVLGAGGDRDRSKRPLMGAAAAAGADLVVVTDDNPRSEDPAAIRSAVLAGVPDELRDRVVEVEGRDRAVRRAVEGLTGEDAVVLLGKGHESGQEVAGTTHPFDDREELARALHERAAQRLGQTRPTSTGQEGTR